jgi:hypothetical protein
MKADASNDDGGPLAGQRQGSDACPYHEGGRGPSAISSSRHSARRHERQSWRRPAVRRQLNREALLQAGGQCAAGSPRCFARVQARHFQAALALEMASAFIQLSLASHAKPLPVCFGFCQQHVLSCQRLVLESLDVSFLLLRT